MRMPHYAAVMVVSCLAGSFVCQTANAVSKAEQLRNTVIAIHGMVKNLDQSLGSSVDRLNETSAELLTRVDAADQNTRRLLSVVEENQARLEELQQRLDELTTTLYKYLDLSPPTALAQAPAPAPQFPEPDPVELDVRSGPIIIQEPTEQSPRETWPDSVETDSSTAPSSEEADSYYVKARELYTEHDYRGALEQFDSYLLLFPESTSAGQAQYWKALCHLRLDELESAIQEFDQLLLEYPSDGKVAIAMHNKAVAYSRLGNVDQAKLIFEELIQKFPDSVVADLARDKLRRLQDLN